VRTGGPALRVIDASASPEEVAAIVAAVSVALGAGGAPAPVEEQPPAWITASRLRSRRAGVRWSDWRRSERLGGRVRA
jgi:hypothetical protein